MPSYRSASRTPLYRIANMSKRRAKKAVRFFAERGYALDQSTQAYKAQQKE